MRSPSTRLLAALPLAVAAAVVLAPAAHATTTPAPPPIEATPAAAPAPATALPSDGPVPAAPATAVPGQVSRIPEGAPETGGGATADDPARTGGLVVLGGLGLAGAGAALALRRRTPRADRG